MGFMATTDMYIEMRTKKDLAEDKLYEIEKQYDKMLEERNSLIDDIDWQQKKIERLGELNNQLTFENRNYEYDIKALREQNYKYCKLSNHIRLKAEMNPGVSRYIDLVNFINSLERE